MAEIPLIREGLSLRLPCLTASPPAIKPPVHALAFFGEPAAKILLLAQDIICVAWRFFP